MSLKTFLAEKRKPETIGEILKRATNDKIVNEPHNEYYKQLLDLVESKTFVDYKGIKLVCTEYLALERVAGNAGLGIDDFELVNHIEIENIKDFQKSKVSKISIENGHISGLHIKGYSFDDLKLVSKFNYIRELNLRNNKISKIEGLDNLIDLVSINLKENKITKIEGIKNLPNLRYLYVQDNLFSPNDPILRISGSCMGNVEIYASRKSKYEEQKKTKESCVTYKGAELARSEYEVLENIVTENVWSAGLGVNDFEVVDDIKPLSDYSWQGMREKGKKIARIQIQNKHISGLYVRNYNLNNLELLKGISNLSTLLLPENNIQRMKGLENLKNLKFLQLDHNKIRTIEGLDNAETLKTIRLNYNDIDKIVGLERLKNLEELDLSHNRIGNIEGLDNLENLQKLILTGNPIKKIEGLDNLKNLTNFQMYSAEVPRNDLGAKKLEARGIFWRVPKPPAPSAPAKQVTYKGARLVRSEYDVLKKIAENAGFNEDDIEFGSSLIPKNEFSNVRAVKENENITGLYIRGYPVNDLELLGKLVHLKHLYLRDASVSKIKGFERLVNLKAFHLDNNQIIQIEGLDGLDNLISLNLGNNKIKHIEGLENLTNLKNLTIYNNQLTEIQGLDKLKNLRALKLFSNQITHISRLDSLEKLEYLNLCINKITDIEGLDNLQNLRTLRLGNNNISKINPFALPNLSFLSLDANKIEEIEGLEKLKKLEYLHLEHNKIKKIQGLSNLVNLKRLNLENNQIEKIEGLNALKKLDHLILSYNPLKPLRKILKLPNLKILEVRGSSKVSKRKLKAMGIKAKIEK